METTHTPTPVPSRGAKLATAGILGIIAAAGVGASFTERVERSQADLTRFAATPTVSLSAHDATIDVATATTTDVSLARAVKWAGPDGPTTPKLLPTGELKVRGCDVPWWKDLATWGTCTARYSVTMPSGRSLTASNDTGSLTVTGTFDVMKLTSDVGDIAATDMSVRTLDASVDVGDLRAVLTTSPQQVVLRVDVGSIDLTLPPGQYAIRATTDVGNVSVDQSLVNQQSARTVVVTGNLGDVTIRAAR
jgi:hypothetical protein